MLELDTPDRAASWLHERVSGTLHWDSRRVRAGDGFLAWRGTVSDGRAHVRAALEQGASACLVEGEGVQAFGFEDLPESPRIAAYPRLKSHTGPIAAAYYDHPSRRLDVLAVTGTNGKTSTAWWLAQALSALAEPHTVPCAVIGTLGTGIVPQVTSTGLTTPDPVLLQQQLRRFADDGLAACAMEASSIGLAERRLDGTRIRTALFTNFSWDHLDYHGSLEAYWQAKSELFRWPGLRSAVVNVDDPRGMELAESLQGSAVELWTVSAQTTARLWARAVRYTAGGLCFEVVEDTAAHEVQTRLVGQYNVLNLLGVIAAMRSLGVPLAAAAGVCAQLGSVPGRMEFVSEPGQPLVVVDYAHTPDALEKALAALRGLCEQRGGQLRCVFGCGGDRDATKRPLMAAIAEKNADAVTVTSDNPRSEKPEFIISQILLGFADAGAVSVQADRALAIDEAVAQAGAGDVILVAGKGHEDHQEIAGVRHPFSDQAQARLALQRRARA